MVALVLLDLSAAFDTIDHTILLKRLQSNFGISGKALKWFASYLRNRSQQVKINGITSDSAELKFGVPQGSVLGPLLFTLYMSPVAEITRHFGINNMFYADDSQLYVAFNPREDFTNEISNLELCIKAVKNWMQINFLKLNDSKTEFIIFGSRFSFNICSDIVVQVGDSVINPVTHVRNLGAYLDNLLNMEHFIKVKTKSVHYQLCKLFRIRKCLTLEATKTIVQAMVTSRLDYACSLCYGLNKCHLKQLQRLQDAAARLVLQAPRYSSAEPLRKELHWLPVYYRISFRIATFVFRSIHGKTPSYISEMLEVQQTGRKLRSSHSVNFKILMTFTKLGEKCFSHAAPTVWNALPDHIKKADSINSFKRMLKTFYFCQAY